MLYPTRRVHTLLSLCLATLVALLAPLASLGTVALADRATCSTADDIVIENWQDMVTVMDTGFNDFSGNMGAISSNPALTACAMSLSTNAPHACAMDLDWDFSQDPNDYAFAGMFCSLMGLTDTKTSLDGVTSQTTMFCEHTLDLDDLDGDVDYGGEPIRAESLGLLVDNRSAETVTLKVELVTRGLGGETDGSRFALYDIPPTTEPVTLTFSFRQPGYYLEGSEGDLELDSCKQLSLLIERKSDYLHIDNPASGSLTLHRLWFNTNTMFAKPSDPDTLLDLQKRMAYQHFVDWSSRKEASLWLPQDRGTFADLLSVGAIGFALPAHIIAAENGWITREEASIRVLAMLTLLDDDDAFGPEPVGTIGYKGWFYHFFGHDGRRKQNFDFPETTIDESANTVELSSIDTGLAVMGALVAQSYFDGANDDESEIRERAQSIYDRVDWSFMLDPGSQQFYLGWKPADRIPDPMFGFCQDELGGYSGVWDRQQTLDYYTDEAVILALLALGAEENPVSPAVYEALAMVRNGDVIATYPGALFTYQFLGLYFDTSVLPTRPGDTPATWYDNTLVATQAAIAHAEANATRYAAYGPYGYGISAAEGPFDTYHAYGTPTIAYANPIEEDGTITYYGALCAATYGEDLRLRASHTVSHAWDLGLWHPRFGLPDAYNGDISQADPPSQPEDTSEVDNVLRREGSWCQRTTFGIDQGPMLMALENADTGLIHRLVAANPNIQRGLSRLVEAPAIIPPEEPYKRLIVEAEDGTGDGIAYTREAASSSRTVRLGDGQSQTMTLSVDYPAHYAVRARYSNANSGSRETVTLTLDGVALGDWQAQDTGDGAAGWNTLPPTRRLASPYLSRGTHTFRFDVANGDGAGVELDCILLDSLCLAADRRVMMLPLLWR